MLRACIGLLEKFPNYDSAIVIPYLILISGSIKIQSGINFHMLTVRSMTKAEIIDHSVVTLRSLRPVQIFPLADRTILKIRCRICRPKKGHWNNFNRGTASTRTRRGRYATRKNSHCSHALQETWHECDRRYSQIPAREQCYRWQIKPLRMPREQTDRKNVASDGKRP